MKPPPIHARPKSYSASAINLRGGIMRQIGTAVVYPSTVNIIGSQAEFKIFMKPDEGRHLPSHQPCFISGVSENRIAGTGITSPVGSKII
jgi:hypothetical protein